jgi:mono/diheme cytochrome c family protein
MGFFSVVIFSSIRIPIACIGDESIFVANYAFAKSDDTHKMHQLYQDNCASCHGADHGGYLAPALNSETLKGRSPTALRTLIMTGSFETLMPPFFGRLSDNDIRDMVKYLQSTPKLDNPPWTHQIWQTHNWR